MWPLPRSLCKIPLPLDKQIFADPVPDADVADDVGALPGAGADDHDADDAGADLSEVMCPLLLSERSDGGAVDSPSEKISLGNLKRYHWEILPSYSSCGSIILRYILFDNIPFYHIIMMITMINMIIF